MVAAIARTSLRCFRIICLKSNNSSGQSAAEAWCLVRVLPLMLSNHIPPDDENLELILRLLDCLAIIKAPISSFSLSSYLEDLITDHHELYLRLFGELKPKHHFMLHYPESIRMVGPLYRMCAQRFEGKHNFLKTLGHNICNFINICKSAAERSQTRLMEDLLSGTVFESDVKVGPGSCQFVGSFPGDALASVLGCSADDEVFSANHVSLSGCHYNLFQVIVMKLDDMPVFGRIESIVVINLSKPVVYFVLLELETVAFERDLYAYAVSIPICNQVYRVLQVEDFFDYHPLHLCTSGRRCHEHHVIPRHFY